MIFDELLVTDTQCSTNYTRWQLHHLLVLAVFRLCALHLAHELVDLSLQRSALLRQLLRSGHFTLVTTAISVLDCSMLLTSNPYNIVPMFLYMNYYIRFTCPEVMED